MSPRVQRPRGRETNLKQRCESSGGLHFCSLRASCWVSPLARGGSQGAGDLEAREQHPSSVPLPHFWSEKQEGFVWGTLCWVCVSDFILFCSLCISCHLTAHPLLIQSISVRDPTGSLHIFSEAFLSTPALLSHLKQRRKKEKERGRRGPMVA